MSNIDLLGVLSRTVRYCNSNLYKDDVLRDYIIDTFSLQMYEVDSKSDYGSHMGNGNLPVLGIRMATLCFARVTAT